MIQVVCDECGEVIIPEQFSIIRLDGDLIVAPADDPEHSGRSVILGSLGVDFCGLYCLFNQIRTAVANLGDPYWKNLKEPPTAQEVHECQHK